MGHQLRPGAGHSFTRCPEKRSPFPAVHLGVTFRLSLDLHPVICAMTRLSVCPFKLPYF